MTKLSGLARVAWKATGNFVLPAALAWALVAFGHQFYYGSRLHLQMRPARPYGPISLRIKLPGTAGMIPEPILVCGKPGNAALVYIRLLRHAHARVGVEFWGVAAFESDEFLLPSSDATILFSCSLPAFYPAEGSKKWEGTPENRQTLLRHQYVIGVDGVVRLKGPVNYLQPENSRIYYGSNPLGGSLVSSQFTGTMLNAPDPD